MAVADYQYTEEREERKNAALDEDMAKYGVQPPTGIEQLPRAGSTEAAVAGGELPRTVLIEPESFDFDAPVPEPDYIVDDLIERQTVTVCSGDTGAAKTIHWQDGTVRIIRGEEWLGRKVHGQNRVLYVDEENPGRIVHTRLPALGMTNEDRDSVRYFRRKGISLGDGEGVWKQWARQECLDFKPDVFIIDTAMAATAVDAMDNAAVTALYTTVMRPLAEEFSMAVVILHHERKPGAQEKRNASFAMFGARSWANQADIHMTLTADSEYVETPRDFGGVETHKQFKLTLEKGRDGISSRPERTTVRGIKQPQPGRSRWVLTSLEVQWGGRIEADSAETDFMERMLRQLARSGPEERFMRKDVAAALGEADPAQPSGTFKRAWTQLADNGYTEIAGKAVRLTADGIKAAEALGIDFG